MNLRRGLAVGVGAVVVIGIAITSQAPIRQLSFSGLATGSGTVSSPMDVTIARGADITGTGSAGSPLSLGETIDAFTYGVFGDGSDGDCNWNGVDDVVGDSPESTSAQAYVTESTTYTISGWRFCANATVASDVALDAKNPIFVAGTLTLDGTIHRNGCKPTANATSCGTTTGGFLSGTTASEGSSYSSNCFRKLRDFDHSSVAQCAVAIGAAGAGNHGLDGSVPTLPGCGGGGGSLCSSGATGTGRAAPRNTTAMSDFGSGDLLLADGYASFLDALAGAACAGATGGGGASDGATIRATGGGGAGWVVVHARKIVGGGKIEAKGGPGWTWSPGATNICYGGGGGGGGGVATVVIGGGGFPTIDVSGGPGGTGFTCQSGGCTGLKGGDGAAGHAGVKKLFKLGLN